jgi:ribosomal protein L37AE/L43A
VKRKTLAAAGFILLLVIAASIADNLLRAQHPCEKCQAEMQPFENASSIYKCPQCGFMLDTGFQR